MRKLLLIVMLAFSFTACDRAGEKNPVAVENQYEKDNTGRNVRDRSSHSKTADDQSESEADRTITQRIRKAIMDDGSLSTNAKNIKIITINGVVLLKGPVENVHEKEVILAKVATVQGVKRVDNQLEAK